MKFASIATLKRNPLQTIRLKRIVKWCAWQDSNLYAFRHQILSLNQYFNYQLVKFLYTVCTHFRFVNENELWDTFNREEIPEKTLWFTYLSYL